MADTRGLVRFVAGAHITQGPMAHCRAKLIQARRQMIAGFSGTWPFRCLSGAVITTIRRTIPAITASCLSQDH